jgi:hypothetical protein
LSKTHFQYEYPKSVRQFEEEFFVEELSEQKLKEILDPILTASPERRTHKLKFRISKGVLGLVTIPL